MPIETVAVDEAIRASTQNKLIANANGSPGRAIFTANGSWSVPAGVFRFKVYLAGGGGAGGEALEDFGGGGSGYRGEGGRGGNAPLCSKIFTGYEPGTTFLITIGAGGVASGGIFGGPPAAAGDSTFGTVLSSTHGGVGTGGFSSYAAQGAPGTHNGQAFHTNQLFLLTQNNGYGEGGQGGNATHPNGYNGNPGICVIEW